MAQQAQQPQVVVEPKGRGSNTWGLVGFIVSLIGLLLTCGVLCPIGLILSVVGLGRRPRGLATAGLIIGIVGSVLLVVAVIVGFGTVAAHLGVGGAVARHARTQVALGMAGARIEEYRQKNDALPDETEAGELIGERKDAWGTPLRYERTDDDYDVVSAGRDRKFDTPDDISLRHPGPMPGRRWGR